MIAYESLKQVQLLQPIDVPAYTYMYICVLPRCNMRDKSAITKKKETNDCKILERHINTSRTDKH